MAKTITKNSKKNRKQLLAKGQSEWPKTVMGVKVYNQKDMDRLIRSIRGENIPGFKGRLD